MILNYERNSRLPSSLYSRLDATLIESNVPENVVPHIFGEFTLNELQRVTQILLETIQDLQEVNSKQKELLEEFDSIILGPYADPVIDEELYNKLQAILSK